MADFPSLPSELFVGANMIRIIARFELTSVALKKEIIESISLCSL